MKDLSNPKNAKPKAGSLLLANAYIGDPNFEKSCILILEHNEKGTFGFKLNQLLTVCVSELLPDLCNDLNCKVFMGGPVETNTLHFMHKRPDYFTKNITISGDVYFSDQYKTLIEGLNSAELKPNDVNFYLGYSGWGPGQLDEELKEKTWLVIPETSLQLDALHLDYHWQNAMRKFGGTAALWADAPDDPNLN